ARAAGAGARRGDGVVGRRTLGGQNILECPQPYPFGERILRHEYLGGDLPARPQGCLNLILSRGKKLIPENSFLADALRVRLSIAKVLPTAGRCAAGDREFLPQRADDRQIDIAAWLGFPG